jgi:hypothetical protein
MTIFDYSNVLCAATFLSASLQACAAATSNYKPITAGSLDNSFNFLMHGDWGWNSFNQTLTAYEMGVYGWLVNAEFVIALGDNVCMNQCCIN